MKYPERELKLANVLPPLFICIVIGTIWSIYLGLHLLPQLQLHLPAALVDQEAAVRGWIQLFISQKLTAMLLICYARAMLTSPGSVPDAPQWKIGSGEAGEVLLPFTREVKITGERRHCKWCLKYKPDRCHHCRICMRCVLKMDHHCPWIMNCVGFRNHKYFFLLVVYSVLNCAFVAPTVFESVWTSSQKEMPESHRFLLVLCLVLASIMGSLLMVFLTFHTWLMLSGMTTIEFCEKSSMEASRGSSRKPSRYNLGAMRNICAVLGPRPLLWLLPVGAPEGDGIAFAWNEEVESHDPEWTGTNPCSSAYSSSGY